MRRSPEWMPTWQDLVHLTPMGRLVCAYYTARRLIGLKPAVDFKRCIMGYPVGEHVRCFRPVEGEAGLWCKWHDSEANK